MRYETRDSETAAVLTSQNQRFTTESRGDSVWFIFEDPTTCETIIDAHLNKELLVHSLDLTNAAHEIKKIIIRHKNNERN